MSQVLGEIEISSVPRKGGERDGHPPVEGHVQTTAFLSVKNSEPLDVETWNKPL
jgi:hypothetical protein